MQRENPGKRIPIWFWVAGLFGMALWIVAILGDIDLLTLPWRFTASTRWIYGQRTIPLGYLGNAVLYGTLAYGFLYKGSRMSLGKTGYVWLGGSFLWLLSFLFSTTEHLSHSPYHPYQ